MRAIFVVLAGLGGLVGLAVGLPVLLGAVAWGVDVLLIAVGVAVVLVGLARVIEARSLREYLLFVAENDRILIQQVGRIEQARLGFRFIDG